MYEVIWSRLVTYRFGATLDAVTTVLVAFMGGLALGAWLFGRLADRMRRPLAMYGWLEIAIGLSVALLPLGLYVIMPLYRGIVAWDPDALLVHRIARFLMVVVMILIPTTAMGATLPALSRFLTARREALGLNVGGLYALNTIGALLGAFSAGFFFIISLGVFGTLYLAVALNILVGSAAIWASRAMREDIPVAPPETASTAAAPTDDASPRRPGSGLARTLDPGLTRFTLYIYAVSGFLALAYQVVWFRALVFNFEFLKNTTYSFSAMLTVFLAGIGLGSAVMTRFVDRLDRPYLTFGLLQILIAAGGIFSFLAIRHGFGDLVGFTPGPDGSVDWVSLVLLLFAQTGVAILPATLAMGLLFPVAVRCYVGRADHVGEEVGTLYAFNTVGNILGATLASFLIIPALGIAWSIIGLALCSLMLGLAMIWRGAELGSTGRLGWTLGPVAVFVLVLAIRIPHEFPIPMQAFSEYERLVYYADGSLGTISVVENSKRERTIYVDNVGVAGTDPMLLTDQKSLAHVPMLMVPEPRNVLTVGFGSGGASYSFSTWPMLEHIHCVEIDPTVVRAAYTLTASNWGIVMPKLATPDGRAAYPMSREVAERMERYGRDFLPAPLRGVTGWVGAERHELIVDERGRPTRPDIVGYFTHEPRFRIILDDARSYLQSTTFQYDIIATDCTDLRYKTNANLYDLEYFRICRERLTDQGMVVVWMPLGGLRLDIFQTALKTFAEVFPNMTVWYMNNEPTHYILLIGWKGEAVIDVDLMKSRLAQTGEAREDLAELNLDSLEKLLSCYLTDTRALDFGDVPINTENYPIIEFLSPKFGYSEEPLLDNLRWLAENQNDITPLLRGSEETLAEMAATLPRWFEAVPHILDGHEEYRRIATREAALHYMEAIRLVPEDRATRRLLDFPEVRLLAESNRSSASWYMVEYGLLMSVQGRDAEALTWLERAIRTVPPADQLTDAAGHKALRDIMKTASEEAALIYERNNQPQRAERLRRALEPYLAP